MNRLKQILSLLLDFLRFGCFTFGGGWSIVAQMQQLYVEKKKIITTEELLDMTSVGRSMPGVMISNVAMLFGYHVAGFAGGMVCVLGMILPPLLILMAVSSFYAAFCANPWVIAAMTGMRAAVVPIIASAAMNLVKGSFKYPPCYVVAVGAFALYLFFHVSCVLLTLIGLVAGIAISEFYERRGGMKHDGAA